MTCHPCGCRMTRYLASLAVLSVVLLAAGCGGSTVDPKQDQVMRGVAKVKSLINSTATSPIAALSLASLAEQGGTIISYIAASLPDDEKFTCYVEGPRPQPYCVTVKPGASPGEYIIEGYAGSTDKPIATERASASMPRRR